MNSDIYYFGYGSLVNTATLQTPFKTCYKATLKGWKRLWIGEKNNRALLSVECCENSEIDGLVIADSADSLPLLDEREIGYSRHSLNEDEIIWHEKPDSLPQCFLYICDDTQKGGGILRSYLDVVLQGYLHQFGKEGVERFIKTTGNFDCPIIEDRDNPHYPRAVTLTNQEKKLFDTLL